MNRDRAAAARELAATTGAIVLLKGAATLTASPQGALIVNPTGGPILGSGGTGDVLLGLLTGFLAQGVPVADAAALAAYVHGAAADDFAEALGGAGLLAGELAAAIPETIAALRASEATAQTRLVAAFPEP